jgi:hypothetical protein
LFLFLNDHLPAVIRIKVAMFLDNDAAQFGFADQASLQTACPPLTANNASANSALVPAPAIAAAPVVAVKVAAFAALVALLVVFGKSLLEGGISEVANCLHILGLARFVSWHQGIVFVLGEIS